MLISELDFNDYRARTHVFAGLAGFVAPDENRLILTGAGNRLKSNRHLRRRITSRCSGSRR